MKSDSQLYSLILRTDLDEDGNVTEQTGNHLVVYYNLKGTIFIIT